jgi:hypothetical protein
MPRLGPDNATHSTPAIAHVDYGSFSIATTGAVTAIADTVFGITRPVGGIASVFQIQIQTLQLLVQVNEALLLEIAVTVVDVAQLLLLVLKLFVVIRLQQMALRFVIQVSVVVLEMPMVVMMMRVGRWIDLRLQHVSFVRYTKCVYIFIFCYYF